MALQTECNVEVFALSFRVSSVSFVVKINKPMHTYIHTTKLSIVVHKVIYKMHALKIVNIMSLIVPLYYLSSTCSPELSALLYHRHHHPGGRGLASTWCTQVLDQERHDGGRRCSFPINI